MDVYHEKFFSPLGPQGGDMGVKIFLPLPPQNFLVQLPQNCDIVCGTMSPANRENLVTCVRSVFELAYFNNDAPV